MKLGVVGATGLVGENFLNLLEVETFPLEDLRLFASDRTAGETLSCRGKTYTVQTLKDGCFDGLQAVFFSVGDELAKEWAPKAAQAGAFAIDNSAAFRMSKEHQLIVPEVNGNLLKGLKPQVIANPNCSTIQLVVALEPLKKFGIQSVHVASYQAVSGAGRDGIQELISQMEQFLRGEKNLAARTFAHPIALNAIPHIGSFNDDGFSSEEVKIMNETRKIMSLPELDISTFTVRIPALNSHSEAVWVDFGKPVAREEIVKAWDKSPGLTFMEQKNPEDYPTARMASGQNDVFVGRLHQDPKKPNRWLFWCVSDNLTKGAALNGLQIAKSLFQLQ